ncbi:putative leucine-rich repeat-containing protein DDB_G0290503 [Nilaparvata lugens]|uniref:putative leucine-rich repeat-containing protein DDB_G0290503 n=1 Tax=Nilaparvata lugens TaxID=108931 RepID=UPI00193EB09A|nr:putative leucine-rich repeat-containing protein DDB_G0290503 [Nilaparvata lugens]
MDGDERLLECRNSISKSGNDDSPYSDNGVINRHPHHHVMSNNGSNDCGSQHCFQIAQEIDRIYEERLEAASEGKDIQLEIFQHWVKDLREQNDNLKHVVIKLEQDFLNQCMNCCEMEQYNQKRIEDMKKMLSFKEKIIERQKNFIEQMRNYKFPNQNKPNRFGLNNTQLYDLKSNTQNKRGGSHDFSTNNADIEHDDLNNNQTSDKNFDPCNCKSKSKRGNSGESTKYNDILNNHKDDKVNELTAQLEEKEKLISNLQEQLKTLKCMPNEVKPLIAKIKEFVKTMSEILKKSRNEDSIMRLLTCLECISLCLNELQLIVDHYKENQREKITPRVTLNNDSSSVTEIFRRKPPESSETSVKNDVRNLMREVHDQEEVIDSLRNALADAQDHIKSLNASNYALKKKNECACK